MRSVQPLSISTATLLTLLFFLLQDHVAFRKLLAEKNPVAVEVHAAFSATRDHTAFNAGVIKAVRGSSFKTNAPNVKTSLPKSAHPQAKTANGATKPVAVCRHMQNTGNCKSGNSCKFSHDVAVREAAAVEPKLGRVALSKQDKTNNQPTNTLKAAGSNTPPRPQNRQAVGTSDLKTAEPADSQINPPKSPADRAAGTYTKH